MEPSDDPHVVLVDADDREVGVCDKLRAHEGDGLLHRAFSVFLRDDRGFHLIQRRALGKYHFGGLWTNACCSHPMSGEDPVDAAHRRMGEELGLSGIDLDHAGRFEYSARDPHSGLVEREVDHVFLGRLGEGRARGLDPNPEEVAEVRWIATADLLAELAASPASFTPWFPIALEHARRLRPDFF